MAVNFANVPSIISILQKHVLDHPHQEAFIFLADGKTEKDKISYQQLDLQAKQIAYYLQEHAEPGDRILLCYSAGLEFVSAFMGCLYAGMIAVPAFPLRNNRHAERLKIMIDDCQAKIILSTESIIEFMVQDARFKSMNLFSTEKLEMTEVILDEVKIDHNQIAFLQYTSGSTGHPKGVMVSHGNIMHNARCLEHAFGYDQTTNKVTVFWIPVQHDMSLIGEIIVNLFVGGTGVMLSPTAFIERPLNWLQAISHYRAHYAAAPNFAFDLCVAKIRDDEKSDLDLSCWQVAMNASEPVRCKTLERFYKAFEVCGFKSHYAMPAYGLAESTLLLSGCPLKSKPIICTVDKTAYERGEFRESHKGITLTSSGKILWAQPDHEVQIVDTNSLMPCNENIMGEIWIKSASVAQGYWQKTDITKQIFQAYLADGRGPYLRTGDLGILYKEELYITGRLKDIIILQGRNLYPQDIEAAVEAAHPAVRLDCTAAFSIEHNGEEQLIIVAEIERTQRKSNLQEILQKIRTAVIESTEVIPFDIQLLQPAQALKTTSGKIQRKATKEAYLKGELKTLTTQNEANKARKTDLADDIREIYENILNVKSVSSTDKFSQLGGDSFKAVLLCDALGKYLNNKDILSSSVAFDYPTLELLTQYIKQVSTGTDKEEIKKANAALDIAEPIAIIGMSCRFPGAANNLNSFWNVLLNGNDTISKIPNNRWSISEINELKEQESTIYGAFIEDIKNFDTEFFNISPVEAIEMDPQQRLLLELSWHALEDAGINPANLKGTDASVFIGATAHEYGDLLLTHGESTGYFATGNTLSVLSGRISYFLGLEGPSLTIDTACSSSLVALHEACNSLSLGETHLAIVGGVNALLSPNSFINLTKANMLAADGHCKVFSADANGYVRGEGCGVVILKKLHQAEQDNDRILGIIKSTVVNQDGASSGLTVPNGVAQEHLLLKALHHAKLEPKDIDYIEAHGTGTIIGDPMEMHAINNVYKNSHINDNPLFVGSVKANIGHLEAAAGIAGLIKVLLSLQAEKIPAQIYVNNVNPKINLAAIPTTIPMQAVDWKANDNRKRCAGISSFGFSGTNAHVILEEGGHNKSTQILLNQEQHLLIISAKTETSLQQQISQYIDFLKNTTEKIQNICYTSQKGRYQFEYLVAVLGANIGELVEKLQQKIFISNDEVEKYQYSANIKLSKVSLPLYVFEDKTYWAERLYEKQNYLSIDKNAHPLLSQVMHLGAINGIVFSSIISQDYPSFVRDHCVFTIPVVTGPAYISAIISALYSEEGTLTGEIQQINFSKPLALTGEESREVQIFINDQKNITVQSKIASSENDWIVHATANISNDKTDELEQNLLEKMDEIKNSHNQHISKAELYDEFMQNKGNTIRGHSCWLDEVWGSTNKGLGRLRLPGVGEDKKDGFILHQGCIESCVYLAAFLQSIRNVNDAKTTYLPYAIDSVRYALVSKQDPIWVYIEYSNDDFNSSDLFKITAYLLDASANVVCTLEGFTLKAASKATLLQSINGIDNLLIRPEPKLKDFINKNPLLNLDEANVLQIVSSRTSVNLGITLDEIAANLNKGFMDMGMDSLIAVELSNQLKQYFGEKIIPNATVLYNYPNVKALSNYIAHYGEKSNHQNSLMKSRVNVNEPIAVVGMSGHFPGAADGHAFWQLLSEGKSAIVEVPETRWDSNAFYNADVNAAGKMCSKKGGFLNIPIGDFDANFFGISPREATYIDPQQRILLETTWEALEDACINPIDLKGSKTGVYIGIWNSDYNQLLNKNETLEDINQYTALGGGLAEAAGRISYTFGLQGPSVSINTVCSSSLVALHHACESLQLRDSDTVLVGGVNLILDPATSIGFSQMHMLSPDGFCKTFDETANGYVRGEGCGILVLKRLSDARKSGDRILTVIKATGVNQDGASSGFTAPNGLAQEELLRTVVNKAKLNPSDITYLETHGTGTELGDPIEVGAIKTIYSEGRDHSAPLILGALKSNIGHLESAAGIASLVKIILSFENEQIPRNLHFTKLNPKIDIDSIPAIIPTTNYAWPRQKGTKRYAAVSAFGATGTNAHAILEEALDEEWQETQLTQKQHLLLISAKTSEALQQQIEKYINYLETTQENIQNICYTSQIGRCLFDYKIAVAAENVNELIAKLINKQYCLETEYESLRYPAETRLKKVKLPTYAFQHKYIWAEKAHIVTKEKGKPTAEFSQSHFTLVMGKNNMLDDIYFKNETLPELGPEQVLIGIKYTGINLRDVLAVMGLYPGYDGKIGLECSGEVLAVGNNVKRFVKGDYVLGITPGSYTDVVLAEQELLVNIPKNISLEQAATLPIAYLTAYVGLQVLAKIKPGEKVLIHAAVGGVGLAAIYLAKYLGADIYATVGNETKQDFLKALGIKHIYNSRDTQFSQKIINDTQDQGVDIVLNSLTGEGFIAASVACCAPSARFIEMGRVNIWERKKMHDERADISYEIMQIENIIKENPEQIQVYLQEIVNSISKNEIMPLPFQEFDINNVKEAFSYLQQAKNIGKVILKNSSIKPIEKPEVQIDKQNPKAVHDFVCKQVSKILGIEAEELDETRGFFELGMDSLTAAELNRKLTTTLGTQCLTSTSVFDYPNVSQLIQHINAEFTQDPQLTAVKKETKTITNESIAIIGVSCRIADAKNSEEFWELLLSDKDTISTFITARKGLIGFNTDSADYPGSFIDDIEQFDPGFFGISPKEAEIMDPQQRVLTEVSWEALENANIKIDTLKGSNVGVFIGAAGTDYGHLLERQQQLPTEKSSHVVTGTLLSALSGRISYLLGIQGPSVTLDTACSASLVAIHEACESLKRGDCELALAGGVNIILDPLVFKRFSQAGIISPSGCCHTFDIKADGYVRGEGCGIVVLKRLSDARRDNDSILAIIKGSGINQDGASSGFTVPSGSAQVSLMRHVLAQAEVDPKSVSYIETHGTGTSLGDPIEVNAIGEVYGQAHSADEPITLGALKSQIGHLETASGVASLIKVIECLRHQALPKNLHFTEINPHIDLTRNKVQLSLENTAWTPNSLPRRAAISSFGFTGTNAHIIVEEASSSTFENKTIKQTQHLLIISAKTPEALSKQIEKYQIYLKATTHPLQNICFTSQWGRMKHACCVGVLGENIAEIIMKLNAKDFINNDDINKYIYNSDINLRKVTLPTYAFDNKRYWAEELSYKQIQSSMSKGVHPLLGQGQHLGAIAGTLFSTKVSSVYPDFIADHRIFDIPVLSGPAYISAILSALYFDKNVWQGKIDLINFYQPLALQHDKTYDLQFYIDKKESNGSKIKIQSKLVNDSEWMLHAAASLSIADDIEDSDIPINELHEKILNQHDKYLSKTQLYDEFMKEKGNTIRGHSCWIDELWCDKHNALGRLRLPGNGEGLQEGFRLHPGCIESSIYLAAVLRAINEESNTKTLYLPYAIEETSYNLSSHEDPMWIYVEYLAEESNSPEFSKINASFVTVTGKVILQLRGIWLKQASPESLMQSLQENKAQSIALQHETINTVITPDNEVPFFDEQQVLEIIRSQMSRILGTSQEELTANSEKGFMEFGMESLSAVELAKLLKEYFGEKIIPNATVLYNYPNIKTLSEYVINYYSQKTTPTVVNKTNMKSNEPIAIIGMSGCFPASADIRTFWQLLAEGKSGITEVPANRWNVDEYYDPDINAKGKICSRNGGFLNTPVENFDAAFFGMSPREATYVDPQQRLLLENSWKALENACINPSDLRGSRTGVYIGIWTSDYHQMLAKNQKLTDINAHGGLGSGLAEPAGRISYLFGLQGPSVAIDTVCSSSLVALHHACQGLELGDCDAALVGGVNLLLDPATSIGFCQMHMLSPDGYCKTFDASANGYVRGEGCGIVVLKRLSDAKRNGDRILAVIKATGVNQDGASSGFTAPNGVAQERLLREVLAKAELKPTDISYIETHGTGTELGDPIEVSAIKSVYGEGRDHTQPLILGALKTNIGHLESAAGIASLTKVILALEHETIPANLHFNQLNTSISLDDIPAVIPTTLQPWHRNADKKRYAAISAFGATGTNAHVILEEPPEVEIKQDKIQQTQHLLVISAKTQMALQQQIENHLSYLKSTSENIQNICYTSQTAKCLLEHKVYVLGENAESLINKLEQGLYANEEEVIKYKYQNDVKLAKVILPSYPFEHKPYWVKELSNANKLAQKFLTNDNNEKDVSLQSDNNAPLINENQITDYIYTQIGDVLGMNVSDIDSQKSFTELGFDSLMVVELSNRLKKLENKNLEIKAETIYQYPTTEKLVDYLTSQHNIPENKERYNPLCCFKTQGENPALFCVHGVDGHAEIFTDLALEGQLNRPIYAFQGLESLNGVHYASLEERAAMYINAMQAVQTHGPYYILGWSMGGAIALEMAYQLQQMHEEIAFLGMADGLIRGLNIKPKLMSYKAAAKFYLYIYSKNANPEIYQVLEQAQDNELAHFIKEACQADVTKEKIHNEILMIQENFNQLLNYNANNIIQPLVLFLPDNAKNKTDDHSLFGFKRVLKGSASKDWKKLSTKVKVHPVGGDHFTMLEKKHNEKLHLYLRQYLSES